MIKAKKQITLDDIAKQLNISKVTVSKALRDHPDISAETKKLVKETARKLDYVPNYFARNLSARKSNTIGLVVPKIAHHFFAFAVETIYQTAYKNNYEIIMTVSQENTEHEISHIQTLLAMHVDGLLVSLTQETSNTQIFETVRDRNVPLVFFDRVVEGLGFSTVTTDDEVSSYSAIVELVKRGYTKIAHLAGYQHTNIGRNRLKGFLRVAKNYNLQVPENWIIEGGFGEEDGYKGFLKLFKSGKLPEVVFTVTYPVALGMLLAADELSLSVPGDIDILCFGGSIYNRFIKPSLSFIDQPADELAAIAAELLFKKIAMPGETETQNIKLPARVVFCETCKPRNIL